MTRLFSLKYSNEEKKSDVNQKQKQKLSKDQVLS